jgi:hypothetical protein
MLGFQFAQQGAVAVSLVRVCFDQVAEVASIKWAR